MDTIGRSCRAARPLRVSCLGIPRAGQGGGDRRGVPGKIPLVTMHLEATGTGASIEERFDVAVRVRQPPLEDSNLVIRKLGQGRLALVASPAFLERQGRPEHPEQLAGWPSGPVCRHVRRGHSGLFPTIRVGCSLWLIGHDSSAAKCSHCGKPPCKASGQPNCHLQFEQSRSRHFVEVQRSAWNAAVRPMPSSRCAPQLPWPPISTSICA